MSKPLKSRDLSHAKNSRQLASDSLSPIIKPKISRYPSSLMPTAIITARGRTRPSSRILTTSASTRTSGYRCSRKLRLFHASTMGSRRLHSADTVDLENSVPQSSSVIWATQRVDTPFTTISINAITSACSLR